MRRSRWSMSGMYVRDLDLAEVNVLFLLENSLDMQYNILP